MSIPKQRKGFFRRFMSGKILTHPNVRAQIGLLVLLFLMVFVYMHNDYKCEGQEAKIKQLETELDNARMDELNVSTKLVQIMRQSSVMNLLKKNGSQLQESETPAIRIE